MGELWAAPLLVLLASLRRTTARAADGHGRRGVLSHVLLEAPLPSRFFSPLSSSLGGVSSPASSLLLLLRGGTVVRVFQDVNVAALQGAVPPSCSRFAWAVGNPTTRQENENDGRGGVTDDHLRRMRLSRPPRPTYSVSYLYSRVLYIAKKEKS